MKRTDDRGAVTVEAAIALISLVTVLALTFAGLLVLLAQLRCTDAAREAALLVARGHPELAGAAVGRMAPSGARWETHWDDLGVTVTVLADPPGRFLPGVRLRAEAFAVPEPGVREGRAVPASRTGR